MAGGTAAACNVVRPRAYPPERKTDLGVAPSIVITVTAPEAGGTITNTATVSGSEVDLDPGDNSSSAHTLAKPVFHVYLPAIFR